MTRECGKCGDPYPEYTVFVPDTPGAIAAHAHIKDEHGSVCPDCRAGIAPSHCISIDGENR